MKRDQVLAIGIIVSVGVAARILGAENGWFNVAPIAAVGLFSGSIIQNKKWAFLVALFAQFAADVYFQIFTSTPGFYGVAQWFTYAGLIAVTALGTTLRHLKVMHIAGFTLGGSLLFFFLSNLGVFAGGYYGNSAQGFFQTYIAAIPFFKNAVLGDCIGSAVLFGSYALGLSFKSVLRPA